MDGLRHRRFAKAAGNSHSPYLQPPRLSSTLLSGGGRANGLGSYDASTAAPPDPRASMAGEPLRQEQVPGSG